MLTDERALQPQEGEIIVSVVRRARTQQISIHPRYLVPWQPVDRCEVVITDGHWIGTMGVVKGREGEKWVITFTVDNDSRDFVFMGKDIVPIETPKK